MRVWTRTYVQNPFRIPQRVYSSSLRSLKQKSTSVPTNSTLLSELQVLDQDQAPIESSDGSTTSTTSHQPATLPEEPPSPSHSLPQSPLTDPKLNAARFGHKKPKPTVKPEDLAPFQIKLRKNPYGKYKKRHVSIELSILTSSIAQALATPSRQCLFTGQRLPSYFLLQMGIATHPETGAHWHLPNLAAKTTVRAGPRNDESGRVADHETQQEEDLRTIERLPSRTLGSTYYLSTYKTLDFVSRRAGTRNQSKFPHRLKTGGVVKPSELVWREDMAGFSLGLMRIEIVALLEKLADRTSRIYLVPCDNWEDVSKKRDVAAVLWLGQPGVESVEENEGEGSEKRTGGYPPLYAMSSYKCKHVPIYNMESLLGADHVRGLTDRLPDVMAGSLAVLKSKRLTVDLQMKLWKLMGYLSSV